MPAGPHEGGPLNLALCLSVKQIWVYLTKSPTEKKFKRPIFLIPTKPWRPRVRTDNNQWSLWLGSLLREDALLWGAPATGDQELEAHSRHQKGMRGVGGGCRPLPNFQQSPLCLRLHIWATWPHPVPLKNKLLVASPCSPPRSQTLSISPTSTFVPGSFQFPWDLSSWLLPQKASPSPFRPKPYSSPQAPVLGCQMPWPPGIPLLLASLGASPVWWGPITLAWAHMSLNTRPVTAPRGRIRK